MIKLFVENRMKKKHIILLIAFAIVSLYIMSCLPSFDWVEEHKSVFLDIR